MLLLNAPSKMYKVYFTLSASSLYYTSFCVCLCPVRSPSERIHLLSSAAPLRNVKRQNGLLVFRASHRIKRKGDEIEEKNKCRIEIEG